MSTLNDCEIPDVVDNLLMSRTQRRTKRLIPETEKDEKYWTKRHKNNEAAKRSRENKRHMESAVRNRVRNLEEENALLRRELSLLKSKFNIPESQSFLTSEDRAKSVELALERQLSWGESKKNDVLQPMKAETFNYAEPSTQPNFPVVLLARLSAGEAMLDVEEGSDVTFNDDRLFRYSQKDLGTPPKAHSPGVELRKYETVGEEELGPADLSIGGKAKRNRDDDNLRILSRFSQNRNNDICDSSSGETDSTNSEDTKEGIKKPVSDSESFGQELKEKLQRLSDQVLKMQKLVENKTS